MKIINFLFNMVTQRFEGLISASMMSVIQDLVNKSRKALLIGISTFIFGVLFAAGVLIATIDAAKQYDTKNVVYITAMLGAGLTLMIISLCALVLILWPRSKSLIELAEQRKAKSQAEPPPQAQASPLEEILAVVVLEAMQYFKNKSEKHTEKSDEKPNAENEKTETRQHDTCEAVKVDSSLSKTSTYPHFSTGAAN